MPSETPMKLRSACDGKRCKEGVLHKRFKIVYKSQHQTSVLKSHSSTLCSCESSNDSVPDHDDLLKSYEVISSESPSESETVELVVNSGKSSRYLQKTKKLRFLDSTLITDSQSRNSSGNGVQVTEQNSNMARTYQHRQAFLDRLANSDVDRESTSSQLSSSSISFRHSAAASSSCFSHFAASEENNNYQSSLFHQHSPHFSSHQQLDNADFSDDEGTNENNTFGLAVAQRSEFWRYMKMFRKRLYFMVSKPLHCDIEYLSRISTFGKKKFILLMLVPLLFCLLLYALQHTESLSLSSSPSLLASSTEMLASLSPFSFLTTKENVWEDEEKSTFMSYLSWLSPSSIGSPFCVIASYFKWQTNNSENVPSAPVDDINPLISPETIILPSEKIDFTESSRLTREEVLAMIMQVIERQAKLQGTQHSHDEVQIKMVKDDITKIKDEFQTFRKEFDSLALTMKAMQSSSPDDAKELEKMQNKFVSEKLHHFHEVNEKIKNLENNYITLNETINSYKNCCQNSTQQFPVEAVANDILRMLMSDKVHGHDFQAWLSSKFIDHDQYLKKISALQEELSRYKRDLKAEILPDFSKKASDLKKDILDSNALESRTSVGSVSTSQIQKIVNSAIAKYDADKTGETDYALESGGGSVVNTRCSETYFDSSPSLSIFGIPLWYNSNSPRLAIQPDVHPGQCWAFKGSQGYLVIQLATTIRPTAFVMEHIPKSLSRMGNLESAPQDFSVWGLDSEKDSQGKLLGKYRYDIDAEPLQHFLVQEKNSNHFSYIELKIHSNHGNLNYTCLYRFRVHGMHWG